MVVKKETKVLSPKLDVVFQALFGEVGNEKITKGFLETILERKIEKIDLNKNPILRREFKDDKLGVLDILAELEGKENCNIELQLIDQKNIVERILYYWSRLYSRQIRQGEEYEKLEKTIVILITNFKISNLEELEYHSTWKIMETKAKKKIILTNKLEIDIIELPKIMGKENSNDKLLDWLYFLENPECERVTKKMEENENLKEAVNRLNTLSEDEYLQRIADLREKAIRDEKAIYGRGIEIGEEQGLKKGIEQGKKQGIKEGEGKGLKKGIKKQKEETARKMLEMGMDIETVTKVTGLKEDDEIIKKLLKEIDIEYVQRIADLREKAIRDEKAIYGRGIEIGEEQGLKKGEEQGLKKGIEQGIKEGIEKGKEETARKMLELGMDIETIIKITDLSKEEIQKIEKNNT